MTDPRLYQAIQALQDAKAYLTQIKKGEPDLSKENAPHYRTAYSLVDQLAGIADAIDDGRAAAKAGAKRGRRA